MRGDVPVVANDRGWRCKGSRRRPARAAPAAPSGAGAPQSVRSAASPPSRPARRSATADIAGSRAARIGEILAGIVRPRLDNEAACPMGDAEMQGDRRLVLVEQRRQPGGPSLPFGWQRLRVDGKARQAACGELRQLFCEEARALRGAPGNGPKPVSRMTGRSRRMVGAFPDIDLQRALPAIRAR